MRCSACGGRTDPDRSFCRRCGSAVFVEDGVFTAQQRASAASLVESETGHAPEAPALPPVPTADALTASTARAARRAASAARKARKAGPQPVAAGGGCIAGLIRWAVFLGFIYYGLNATGLLPDVMQMVREAVNGEVVDTRPIVNKFRAIVDLPPLDDSPAPTAP